MRNVVKMKRYINFVQKATEDGCLHFLPHLTTKWIQWHKNLKMIDGWWAHIHGSLSISIPLQKQWNWNPPSSLPGYNAWVKGTRRSSTSSGPTSSASSIFTERRTKVDVLKVVLSSAENVCVLQQEITISSRIPFIFLSWADGRHMLQIFNLFCGGASITRGTLIFIGEWQLSI